MKTFQFNSLPLHLRESLIFPEAEAISFSENERHRITFYDLKGQVFEVCQKKIDDTLEDIRWIPSKILTRELESLLFNC